MTTKLPEEDDVPDYDEGDYVSESWEDVEEADLRKEDNQR